MALARSAWADGNVLRLRADAWMPYNGDPTASQPGYVVELVKMIFEPKGISIDYQQMPWTDALKAARASEIDGVIGANKTEADGLMVPDEPIGLPRVVLVVRKDSPWKYESVQSLRTMKLGVIEGYSYWEALDAYVKTHSQPQVTFFNGDTPLKDAIAKLKTGEIDAVPETMSVFIWTIKTLGEQPTDYRVAYSHQGEPIYVAFAKSKEGERFARIFDEGIAALRANGKLTELLKRYSLLDWK